MYTDASAQTPGGDIYLYDVESDQTFQVTNDPYQKTAPQIGLGCIVWEVWRDDVSGGYVDRDIHVVNYRFTYTQDPDIQVPSSPFIIEAFLGDEPVTRTLDIRNLGDVELVVDKISLREDSSSEFTVSVPDASVLPVIIQPNEFIEVEITLTPLTTGLTYGYLEIGSNDPDESIVTVELEGFSEYWIQGPKINVDPLSHNFGEVKVGTSNETIITVSNNGGENLTVDVTFGSGSSADFCIADGISLPAVLPPTVIDPINGTIDVKVIYTPTIESSSSAVLEITSDDSDSSLIQVQLSGTGVAAKVPPALQIAGILEFFDTSVELGTLFGDGPGNSALGRQNSLRNKIKSAGNLIENGLIGEACQLLQDAYNRCDGLPRPPDFVDGEVVGELANLILTLMDTLECE